TSPRTPRRTSSRPRLARWSSPLSRPPSSGSSCGGPSRSWSLSSPSRSGGYAGDCDPKARSLLAVRRPSRGATSTRLSREALRATSKLARARQRAEEVRASLVHESPRGAVRVDDHPADRINGELIFVLPDSERREDLNRFRDVARHLAPARLVQDPTEVGCERRRLAREQDFAAAGQPRDPRSEVDARAEVIAVPLDRGPVVEPDTDGRSSVLRDDVMGDPKRDEHCVAGIGDSEHQRAPDRLDMLTSNGRQLSLDCFRELFDQLHGLLIAMGLGKGGEAREVGKEECAGAVRHWPTNATGDRAWRGGPKASPASEGRLGPPDGALVTRDREDAEHGDDAERPHHG